MPSRKFSVAVLTISDRCARGQTVDTSGPGLLELSRRALDAEIFATACVPDEADQIARQISLWSRGTPAPDLILTTGGTGLAPRDVTPEATLSVLERRCGGIMELMRLRCYPQTPRAFLSRGEAGVTGRTLVINLPGAPRASEECLRAILDVLPHAVEEVRGEAYHVDERAQPSGE